MDEGFRRPPQDTMCGLGGAGLNLEGDGVNSLGKNFTLDNLVLVLFLTTKENTVLPYLYTIQYTENLVVIDGLMQCRIKLTWGQTAVALFYIRPNK